MPGGFWFERWCDPHLELFPSHVSMPNERQQDGEVGVYTRYRRCSGATVTELPLGLQGTTVWGHRTALQLCSFLWSWTKTLTVPARSTPRSAEAGCTAAEQLPPLQHVHLSQRWITPSAPDAVQAFLPEPLQKCQQKANAISSAGSHTMYFAVPTRLSYWS